MIAAYCEVWGRTGQPCADDECVICKKTRERRGQPSEPAGPSSQPGPLSADLLEFRQVIEMLESDVSYIEQGVCTAETAVRFASILMGLGSKITCAGDKLMRAIKICLEEAQARTKKEEA